VSTIASLVVFVSSLPLPYPSLNWTSRSSGIRPSGETSS
jgi:hypothetical protein